VISATAVFALLTAVVALLTLIVSHCDTTRAIRDARKAATQQHSDTLAALRKTDATIAVLKGQLDEMHSDRRAWITAANIDLSGDIKYGASSNTINIPLIFDIINTGRAPAIYVFPNVKPFPLPINPQDFTREVKALCALGLTQGISVFPGERKKVGWTSSITSEQMNALTRQAHISSSNEITISPMLAICITYQMSEGNIWYYTPLSVLLSDLRYGTLHISASQPISASGVLKTQNMLTNIAPK
jgi:hypothetical protein